MRFHSFKTLYNVQIFFQFTGECWSGEDAGKTYDKDGSSNFCVTKDFAQCNVNDHNACTGNKTTTFVYNVQEPLEDQQGICANL